MTHVCNPVEVKSTHPSKRSSDQRGHHRRHKMSNNKKKNKRGGSVLLVRLTRSDLLAASFLMFMLSTLVLVQFLVGFSLIANNNNSNNFDPPLKRLLIPGMSKNINTTTNDDETVVSDSVPGMKKVLQQKEEEYAANKNDEIYYTPSEKEEESVPHPVMPVSKAQDKLRPNHREPIVKKNMKQIYKHQDNKEPGQNRDDLGQAPVEKSKPTVDNSMTTNNIIISNNNNNNDKMTQSKKTKFEAFMKQALAENHPIPRLENGTTAYANNLRKNVLNMPGQQNLNANKISSSNISSQVPPPPPQEVDLEDLAKMSCPGPNFSGPDKKCVTMSNRTLPEQCGGNMKPSCFDNLYNKWIMLVGDSNMRYLYYYVDHNWDKDRSVKSATYDGRERFNETRMVRFSYRFTPWLEQSKGCEYCTARTELDAVLEDPRIAYDHTLGTPIKVQMVPDSLTYNNTARKPDAVVMNMGLWEVMELNETEWMAQQPKLEIRFRAILKRWQCEYASTPLIWITTPSPRPVKVDLKRTEYMTRGRLSWLAAMEARIVRNEFPWVQFVDNWSWTDNEDFAGANGYHYAGCSLEVALDLLLQTICSTLERSEKYGRSTSGVKEATC